MDWPGEVMLFVKNFIIILLVMTTTSVFSQKTYKERLRDKVREIKKEEQFDFNGVLLDPAKEYSVLHPVWKRGLVTYRNDEVRFNHGIYAALEDSVKLSPVEAPDKWQMVDAPYAFLFLKDTATTEDLKRLLYHKHPHVRVYAFAALASRNETSMLFNYILEHARDTRQVIKYIEVDFGDSAYPAELMLMCIKPYLTKTQTDSLEKVIIKKWPD